ncbi:hypothetical protein BC629DRAFT_1434255 [Irpex lacteus]|nr:hypothetical protein BC629DRAFT_1434255 [Irpex lacteus]
MIHDPTIFPTNANHPPPSALQSLPTTFTAQLQVLRSTRASTIFLKNIWVLAELGDLEVVGRTMTGYRQTVIADVDNVEDVETLENTLMSWSPYVYISRILHQTEILKIPLQLNSGCSTVIKLQAHPKSKKTTPSKSVECDDKQLESEAAYCTVDDAHLEPEPRTHNCRTKLREELEKWRNGRVEVGTSTHSACIRVLSLINERGAATTRLGGDSYLRRAVEEGEHVLEGVTHGGSAMSYVDRRRPPIRTICATSEELTNVLLETRYSAGDIGYSTAGLLDVESGIPCTPTHISQLTINQRSIHTPSLAMEITSSLHKISSPAFLPTPRPRQSKEEHNRHAVQKMLYGCGSRDEDAETLKVDVAIDAVLWPQLGLLGEVKDEYYHMATTTVMLSEMHSRHLAAAGMRWKAYNISYHDKMRVHYPISVGPEEEPGAGERTRLAADHITTVNLKSKDINITTNTAPSQYTTQRIPAMPAIASSSRSVCQVTVRDGVTRALNTPDWPPWPSSPGPGCVWRRRANWIVLRQHQNAGERGIDITLEITIIIMEDWASSRSLGVFAIQRAMPWVESTEWRDVGGEQSRAGEEEGETRNVLHVVVRAKNENEERAIAVPRSTLVYTTPG